MNRKNIFYLTAVLAVVMIIAVISIISSQVGAPARALGQTADPQQTVSEFFEALGNSDYAAANEFLGDCTLKNTTVELNDPAAQKLFQALGESISFEFCGECRTEGLTAVQTVDVTYLDIQSAASQLNTLVNEQIEALFLEAEDTDALYDENGEYTEEFINRAFNNAVVIMLENAPAYYVTRQIDVDLYFENAEWLIRISDDLMLCMFGGLK